MTNDEGRRARLPGALDIYSFGILSSFLIRVSSFSKFLIANSIYLA